MNRFKIITLVFAFAVLVPCLVYALPGPHDPSSGRGYKCNSCHSTNSSYGQDDAAYSVNVCLRCHSSTGSIDQTKFQFEKEDYANPYNTTKNTRTSVLQTSHKWFGSVTSANAKSARVLAPIDYTSNGLNKSNFPKGYLFCNRCHNVHGNTGLQSSTYPYLRVANDSDQLCFNCHRLRNTADHRVGTHPVNISYTSASAKIKKAAGTLLDNPVVNAANPTAQMKLVKGKVVCSTCHGVHNTDSRSSTYDPFSSNHTTFGKLSSSKGYLLRVDARGKTDTDINICTNCHAKKKAHSNITDSANVTLQHVQCNDCHSGHVEYDAAAVGNETTPNIYLVRRYLQYSTATRVNKRIFYRYTGSTTKEYYNAAGKGVCQACHYPPDNHYTTGSRSTGTLPDASHANCKTCHSHDNTKGSFSYGVGSNCVSACHGSPPVNNNTSGLGSKYPAYTNYDESSTPHASHAAGTGLYYSFGCAQCHKGYNPAMPPATYDNVFLNLTGDILPGPSASYTARKGGVASTCNTVYCHSNGRGGYINGQDGVLWGTGYKDTIIGQGTECTTCHDGTTYSTSHARHTTSMSYGCQNCHAGTVSNNTTLLTRVGGMHVNGVKDVQFSEALPAKSLVGNGPSSDCSNLYCHSNGKGARSIIIPTWGNAASGACGSCHKTKVYGNLSTGGHTVHIANDNDCVKCHTYNGETAVPHVNGTLNVNYGGTGCAANGCHASITPPTWTVSLAGKETCTKCHGKLTNTGGALSASTRYLVAPQYSSATEKGQVSSDTKIGAHKTHLRYLNNFSNYSTVDYRCQACHGTLPGVGTHSNGLSTPQGNFQKLANKWGAMSPTYSGVTCANTYCHNPAGTGGTLATADFGSITAPSWNDPTYLDNSGKSQANCGKCHKVPGDAGFSKQSAHGSMVTNSSTSCSACHGHNGDNTGALGKRHMDGIYYANGACDSCHGYPPMTQAQLDARGGTFVNARLQDYSGGGGFHGKHLLGNVVANDNFTPCLPCHPDSSLGYHQQGGGTVVRANVNVNDQTDTSYRLDAARSKRYNKTAWSCSNVSCHFRPTPPWKP